MADRGRLFYDANGKLRQIKPSATLDGEPAEADLEPVEFVALATDEIANFWAGSALQTNYPFPKWQMGSSSGGGSVTFTDTQIQLREPGNASEASEARAFDDITEFDPAVPGRVRIHISNITVDNNANARIQLTVADSPNTAEATSNDYLTAIAQGNGSIRARTSDDGTSGITTDTSQNNAYVSGLNTVEIAWDGSTLTVTADDGSTTVTVSDSSNYPAGTTLFLKIAAVDSDTGSARNVDFDVDAVEVGT